MHGYVQMLDISELNICPAPTFLKFWINPISTFHSVIGWKLVLVLYTTYKDLKGTKRNVILYW